MKKRKILVSFEFNIIQATSIENKPIFDPAKIMFLFVKCIVIKATSPEKIMLEKNKKINFSLEVLSITVVPITHSKYKLNNS
jgi:hypothetical protein